VTAAQENDEPSTSGTGAWSLLVEGGSGGGSSIPTTPVNSSNTIVERDGSGSFGTNSITLSGNLILPAVNGSSTGNILDSSDLPVFSVDLPNANAFVGTGVSLATATGNSAARNVAVGPSGLAGLTSGTDNAALGNAALSANSAGYENTAVGSAALDYNTTGWDNVALGYDALFTNGSGNYNSAVGAAALYSNDTGLYNAALGYSALNANKSGSSNTALGTLTLSENTDGNNNTAVGYYALFASTSGQGNTATGVNALEITTGSSNTALGVYALDYATPGSNNIAVGALAGNGVTGGSYNIDIGNQGTSNDSGTIRIGDPAHNFSTYIAGIQTTSLNTVLPVYLDTTTGQMVTGGQNYATVGNNLYIAAQPVSGDLNVLRIGSSTQGKAYIAGITQNYLNDQVSPVFVDGNGQLGVAGAGASGTFQSPGSVNVASGGTYEINNVPIVSTASGPVVSSPPNIWFGLGSPSPSAAVGASNIVAVGPSALASVTSSAQDDTALGVNALSQTTTGSEDTAVGVSTLAANISGSWNTAVGSGALVVNSTGYDNVAIGYDALMTNTTGYDNIAIGFQAGNHIVDGNSNIDIGASPGGDESGIIRIGTSQTQAFLAGVQGTALSNAAYPVFIDSTGALGTSTSSLGNGSAYGFPAEIAVYGLDLGSPPNSFQVVGGEGDSVTGSPILWFGLGAAPPTTAGSSGDIAVGQSAMGALTSGSNDTAMGASALGALTSGSNNSAFGYQALMAEITGASNSAFGYQALQVNTGGSYNVAMGYGALSASTTGGSNIAIGNEAGGEIVTGSNNIDIGNEATANDSGTIRIGDSSAQTATYIAGIDGVMVSSSSGTAVYVDSTGKLGTVMSSIRFKEDVQDMGSDSAVLMSLRPVSFRYKPEYDPEGVKQYGLIAEEVEQQAPELVLYNKDGQPESVRYNFVNAMLLNEVQRQQQELDSQRAQLDAQQSELERQKAEMDQLRAEKQARDAAWQQLQQQLTSLASRLDAVEKKTP
jgi:hypothetical protein